MPWNWALFVALLIPNFPIVIVFPDKFSSCDITLSDIAAQLTKSSFKLGYGVPNFGFDMQGTYNEVEFVSLKVGKM